MLVYSKNKALKIFFMLIVFLCMGLFGLNFIKYKILQRKRRTSQSIKTNVQMKTGPKLVCPTYKFSNEMNQTELFRQNAIALPQRQAILRRLEVSKVTMYQVDENLSSKMNVEGFEWLRKNNKTGFVVSQNVSRAAIGSISTLQAPSYLEDKRCKVNQTRSCIENYHYNDFIFLLNTFENPFILRVQFNLDNSFLRNQFYSNHPKPNAMYSLELSNECFEYMKTLFYSEL